MRDVTGLALAAAAPPTSTSTALIGFGAIVAGAILAAVLAGVAKVYTDSVARRAETQRDAVYETQTAALALRAAYIAYRHAQPRPPDDVVAALDDAVGALQLLVARLDGSRERQLVEDWRMVARTYLISEDEKDIRDEQVSWRRMHYELGKYLRGLDRGLGGRRYP